MRRNAEAPSECACEVMYGELACVSHVEERELAIELCSYHFCRLALLPRSKAPLRGQLANVSPPVITYQVNLQSSHDVINEQLRGSIGLTKKRKKASSQMSYRGVDGTWWWAPKIIDVWKGRIDAHSCKARCGT